MGKLPQLVGLHPCRALQRVFCCVFRCANAGVGEDVTHGDAVTQGVSVMSASESVHLGNATNGSGTKGITRYGPYANRQEQMTVATKRMMNTANNTQNVVR